MVSFRAASPRHAFSWRSFVLPLDFEELQGNRQPTQIGKDYPKCSRHQNNLNLNYNIKKTNNKAPTAPLLPNDLLLTFCSEPAETYLQVEPGKARIYLEV